MNNALQMTHKTSRPPALPALVIMSALSWNCHVYHKNWMNKAAVKWVLQNSAV